MVLLVFLLEELYLKSKVIGCKEEGDEAMDGRR